MKPISTDMQRFVLSLVVFGLLAVVLVLSAIGRPVNDIMAGGVATLSAAVAGWWWGSSKGSADKTEMILRSAPPTDRPPAL